MKRMCSFIALLLVFSMLMLSSCDLIANVTGGEETPETPETPSDPQEPENPEESGEPDDPQTPNDPEEPQKPEEEEKKPEVLDPIKIYLVGDSTVCSFADGYYYPRYGYGTQLKNYLDSKATVVNLALSGRSSKSFISESNYQTLKNSISQGDYLIIGFGHNDEKSDDETRFTDASVDYTDESSFGYYLNNYYIQLAIEKGATPILCTPIVRASKDDSYTGSKGHITEDGNYPQSIRDLGQALGVSVIDLTEITSEKYSSIGYNSALKYHAVVAGMYDADGVTVIPNMGTVDETHLNIYGAKFVAYSLAKELEKIDTIKWYVQGDISEPTEEDRVPLEGYKVSTYTSPELEKYNPPSFYQTVSDGWYGTAFGDTGGNPSSSSNGFYATETSEGVFKVGNLSSKNKGKFTSDKDGFAFLFTRVEKDKDFTLTATGEILEVTENKSQTGFGLMIRDDAYINLTAADASILSNYVTAGFLSDGSSLSANFYRENSVFNSGSGSAAYHQVGDSFTATIERIGQTINVKVTYKGITYEKSYYDFDFFVKDTEYMYVGMFSNRGTLIEFTDVEFEITGTSQGA